jgi:DNA ligase (NAD+)
MNNIIEFLNRAARHYYNGYPIISDEQFDTLAESAGYHELGTKQHEDVEKHLYPMYSLQKHYEGEGKNPLEGYKELSMTPKLDGAAVSLLYIEGKLVRALTRGDGKEGRIITDKFLSTNIVPHELVCGTSSIIQVTGEVAAPKKIENARNYAAGALNLGSIEDFKSRSVNFIAYGIQPSVSETFSEDMKFLSRLGFHTINDDGLYEVYPTDGVVFRIDNNEQFYALGYTRDYPRGAYARKVRGKAVETILLGVEWNVGKTGKVTPTAILEPIMIGDKQVSRATLNNPGFIEALDLRIGDKVGVILGGEIIPVITHKVDG